MDCMTAESGLVKIQHPQLGTDFIDSINVLILLNSIPLYIFERWLLSRSFVLQDFLLTELHNRLCILTEFDCHIVGVFIFKSTFVVFIVRKYIDS